MSEWQPIETAPRHRDVDILVSDGTRVWITYWHTCLSTVVNPDTTEWETTMAYNDWQHRGGTHWMPLPEPPR